MAFRIPWIMLFTTAISKMTERSNVLESHTKGGGQGTHEFLIFYRVSFISDKKLSY
jgi:hypothetical protein